MGPVDGREVFADVAVGIDDFVLEVVFCDERMTGDVEGHGTDEQTAALYVA